MTFHVISNYRFIGKWVSLNGGNTPDVKESLGFCSHCMRLFPVSESTCCFCVRITYSRMFRIRHAFTCLLLLIYSRARSKRRVTSTLSTVNAPFLLKIRFSPISTWLITVKPKLSLKIEPWVTCAVSLLLANSCLQYVE